MGDKKYQKLLQRYIDHSDEKDCVIKKVLECAKNLRIPSKILDVGCGTGLISNALANLGHNVTAIDIKNSFIKSSNTNYPVSFIQKDIFSFESAEKFDLIIAAYVFWEIPFEKWETLINQLFSLLNKQGKIFVIDTINNTSYDNIYVDFNIHEPNINTNNIWYEFLDLKGFHYKKNLFESHIFAENAEEMYEILEFFFQSEPLYKSKKKLFLKSFTKNHITLYHSLDEIFKDV